MEIELVNGKWTLNNKSYSELFDVEKKFFEVLLAVEKIVKKYNL